MALSAKETQGDPAPGTVLHPALHQGEAPPWEHMCTRLPAWDIQNPLAKHVKPPGYLAEGKANLDRVHVSTALQEFPAKFVQM